MGIGLKAGGKSKKTKHTVPKSDDIYLKLLVKLCRFMVRRTSSKFNVVNLKRFFMSKVNKVPFAFSRLINFMKGKITAAILVIWKNLRKIVRTNKPVGVVMNFMSVYHDMHSEKSHQSASYKKN